MEMTVNRISPRTAARVLLAACATPLLCQSGNEPQKQLSPPAVNWTQEHDQKNMMDQLGIQALRPGASGNEGDPNHSNYDESIDASAEGPSGRVLLHAAALDTCIRRITLAHSLSTFHSVINADVH
jgi:hypothetical protein